MNYITNFSSNYASSEMCWKQCISIKLNHLNVENDARNSEGMKIFSPCNLDGKT